MGDRQRRGNVIHQSLVRTPLVFGTEPEVIAIEVLVVWGVVVFAGLSLLSLAVAVVFWTCVHPLAMWVAKQDGQMFRLYLRSISLQGYYPAHALRRAPVVPYTERLPGQKR